MQSTSSETLDWKKDKLESRLPGGISINLRYADDTTLMAESEEKLKSLLMKVKEESEKIGLNLNQSEWLWSKNLQAINAGEGVEKREPSYTVGGNAN